MSSDPRPRFSLDEYIAYAREHVPFYRRLYAVLPATPKLTDLPVLTAQEYWEAHHRDRREVLTDTHVEGFVLNSGGTTGSPKYLYCTGQEWEEATVLAARSFDGAGLRDGDRVATLFASGNLYASLMFATDALKRIKARVIQFPIGYSVNFEDIAKVLTTFKINVLAGFPTHLLRVIDALDREGPDAVHLEHIIYAGELFTSDQQEALQARFPGLNIHSAGYASVEGGPIGYADAGCTANEHRVFDGGPILEILDEETDIPIEEPQQPGRIVFTGIIRRLMPLIRYPSGDRAQWIEPAGSPDRKFQLLGRTEEAARVGSDTLQIVETRAMLEPFLETLGIEDFQLLVTRKNLHDLLTFRLVSASDPAALEAGAEEIIRVFLARRADFADAVQRKIIHPPQVEWVRRDQLIVNERTGKLLRVVDRRNG